MKKKIEELVRVELLAKHYAPQSLDDLMNSIFNEGLKERPVINCNNEIIHGHRRIAAMSALGLTEVEVVVEDVVANLFEYTARNIHREKSVEDQIKDIQVVMDKFPKKQGKRNDGTPYVRHEEIIKGLNNKYKDEESIRNLEYVMKNDLEDNLLMRAHIGNNEPLSSCVEFLKTNMKVDQENNYGQLERLKKGIISLKDANKLIQKRYHLENNNGTFIIPDKCYAYQMDCTKVVEISECLNFVDHLFTSIPYFQLRDYDSELECQVGQEETKEKFAESISLFFKALESTLKQSANVQINVGETYVNGLGLDIPNLVKHYILKNTNLVYKETIIWQKINPGYHREYDEKRPINCTEYILWFVVNPLLAKYNNITFKKDEFYIVICNNLLLHIPNLTKPIKELLRVAKKTIIIRTHIHDKSYRVQLVYNNKWWKYTNVKPENEFDNKGNPRSFSYFDIISEDYFRSLVRKSYPRARIVINKDKFNANLINKSSKKEKRPGATKIVNGMQISDLLVLPNKIVEINK
jgi:hypothetical protein